MLDIRDVTETVNQGIVELLQINPEQIDGSKTLTELGADSLEVKQLGINIYNGLLELGLEDLTIRKSINGSMTVSEIVRHICEGLRLVGIFDYTPPRH